jgi:hypothetical protein
VTTDNLRHMLSAYFHQDWPLEYATWQAAVDDFLARSPDRASAVPREIDFVLTGRPEDDQLAVALTDLGSFVHAPSLGYTHGEWLVAVKTRILAEGVG